MLRLDVESRSLNTYVPGGRTFPGTSNGALVVTMVFLFHSSEVAVGANPMPSRATHIVADAKPRSRFDFVLVVVITRVLPALPVPRNRLCFVHTSGDAVRRWISAV